ncbi:ferrous iron transport protein B [Helicobacter enhydrae]|uniref:Ferrous iron transport protein B n=1 Tax=Helicobacter enhydrae TaxID=222136 RepID=A0A1B1U603_9HELI|nr:ferrous iron transport protein B [Helicobacter enhydrae]ANV98224.1 ferrous iron transport protein B [Helicobacter enhydrae]
MKQQIIVALAGQPNVGKSSIINKMSGANLKVGNFTGVTIEKAEATLHYQGYDITIIDLPGTYSLNQYSEEEKIAQDFLSTQHYDLILNVVDSTNLERNLALTSQLLELEQKLLIALNMNDEAQQEGIEIDEKQLSSILGVPCLKVTSKSHQDMIALLDLIVQIHTAPLTPSKRTYHQSIEDAILELHHFLTLKQYPCIAQTMQEHRIASLRRLIVLLLQQDETMYATLSSKPCWVDLSPLLAKRINQIRQSNDEENMQNIFTLDHYAYAKGACLEVQKQRVTPTDTTQKLDAILINKYFGIPIFLVLMWLLFQATFILGAYPKDLIEGGFVWLGELASQHIGNHLIASLIGDGAIQGVGAVLSFLPDILILFLGITLLEATGYMARVAFLLDGLFHRFGLHGKSFIPLVTGFGCSVPAFMSTRMLKNKSDKMLTLFIINFMSCSARLPVYVLFIGTFFPSSQSGNMLFGIYIFGAIVGLCFAKILKLTAFRGIDEPFVMEMPKYRLPSSKLILLSVWNKAKMYLKKAGTFILLASIAIWFAQEYPHNEAIEEEFDSKIATLERSLTPANQESLQEQIALLTHQKESTLSEQSYLGRFGKILSPIFAPFDFDWKLSVALVSGIAAKEVMISTMGVLYSVGEVDDDMESQESQELMKTLRSSTSIPTAIAFIMFVMFYNPCFAATIVFGKEAGGKRYIVYLFAFTSIVAYLFALLGYYATSLVL